VAAIADYIAYDSHDIDDGLRAGIIDLDELVALPAIGRLWQAIGARHPGAPLDRRQRALVSDQIGTMVGDVLDETRRRVAEAGVGDIDEVRAAGASLVGFSPVAAAEELTLKRFLYERLYNSPTLVPVRVEAQRIVANLAAAYRADPHLLPEAWRIDPPDADPTRQLRSIADFIAGMTDRFAIARHEELVGPVELPDRF
jgi:dGTPase